MGVRTESWTLKGVKMHSKYTNQQEEAAVVEFKRTGSIRATRQKIGYPSPATLYRWHEHQMAGIMNWHSPAGSNEACSGKIHSCNRPILPNLRFHLEKYTCPHVRLF